MKYPLEFVFEVFEFMSSIEAQSDFPAPVSFVESFGAFRNVGWLFRFGGFAFEASFDLFGSDCQVCLFKRSPDSLVGQPLDQR